jgi:hypothetical protein
MRNSTIKVRTIRTILLAASLTLIGCTAIESTRHTGYTKGSGLAYYLPKGNLKLLVISEIITPRSAVAVQRQQAQPGAPGAAPQTNAPAQPAQPAQPAPANDGAAAPDTQQQAQSAKPMTNSYVSVDVDIFPDRDARFLLQMTPKATSDDYMKFKVTNGLLDTVTLTNSDQTIGIVSNLALAAIELYKFAAAGPFAAISEADIYITNRTTNVFLVDPFSKAEREKTKADLQNRFGVNVDFTDFEKSIENSMSKCPTNAETPGVFYRPLQRYRFSWDSTGGNGAGSVFLPNAAPVLSMDVKRAAFVSQSYILTLQQGVPVEVTLNKPSQALAASTLPLNLARSLISLPTNLVQLKIDYSSSHDNLVRAQGAQITNLMNLLVLERQFREFQATNNPTTNPPPVTQPRGGRPS